MFLHKDRDHMAWERFRRKDREMEGRTNPYLKPKVNEQKP